MSLEYEKIEKIVLLFWDEQENYEKNETKLKIGTSLYKDICHIYDLNSFKQALDKHNDVNQLFLCLVHLSHSKDNKGFYEFKNSKILKEFSNLNYYLITSARLGDVYGKVDSLEGSHVYTYDGYQEKIFKTFHPQTKNEMLNSVERASNVGNSANINLPKCDYAIITALEEDEMSKILPMINKEGETSNTRHLIEFGHLKKRPSKKIAYASQQSTGMVDAAILATELLSIFNPKFLIMPGVLGGKPKEVNIGDIIVSTKVFTIDKGKLTTDQILKEETVENQVKLVESEQKEINDVFKKELETVSMNSSAITKFIRIKKKILEHINTADPTREKDINLHFGPIACVRQVIDQKGYFEENVLVIDRKAIGLEMESYGVARACELVNNGATTPIIVKSVMDNTSGKDDDAKSYAAWTSAKFVEYILENDII